LIGILKAEFGSFPKEVINILIAHRLFYLSGLAALNDEMCEKLLVEAGELGKPLGVRLILKRIAERIRSKGEEYFLNKIKQTKKSSQLTNSQPLTVRPQPSARSEANSASSKYDEGELKSLLQTSVKNYLSCFDQYETITKDDVVVKVRANDIPITGSVTCQFCKEGILLW
jgi:hypothetical protein